MFHLLSNFELPKKTTPIMSSDAMFVRSDKGIDK